MSQNNIYWEEKISFFSKFLGFDNMEDFEETLDETNKTETQISRRKGIKIVQHSPHTQSMVLTNTYNQQIDKKWLSLIRLPFKSISKPQLLKLTCKGTSYPNKIMPWLSQNKFKINLKLYSLKKTQYRTAINPNNPYRLQKMSPQLQILTLKQGLSKVAELLGIFMLLRQDIQYSQTLHKIGLTVEDYLYDAPVMAFSLLYFLCCSGAYLPFLTNQIQCINMIVNKICDGISSNCSSASFLRRDQISLHPYVRDMIQCFWLNISEPRSPFREKILYFLIINEMSISAFSKVCEATVYGLSRILNQGNADKSVQVLRNPLIFLDKQLFLVYLFS